jgi:hypothetical protein
MKIPNRYIPEYLSRKDRKTQKNRIEYAREQYKKGKYVSRPILSSYKHKKSRHLRKFREKYGFDIGTKPKTMKRISIATGCPIKSLKKILNKGRGAYYSSGSRPNQSAESWAIARLASALTKGNASKIDSKLLAPCKQL